MLGRPPQPVLLRHHHPVQAEMVVAAVGQVDPTPIAPRF